MEIPRIEEFIRYFENIRARTRRVLACIPPESIEWRPRPGGFSFGDLVRHIGATERYMWAENALGHPSRYPGHGPELAAGHDAVMAFIERMHAESIEIFWGLTPDELRRPCTTVGGATLPTWKWLRAMVEHEIHHRGQIYVMLGILGVPTPPLYGLTEQEIRERSHPIEELAGPGGV
ncbi:MAG TPA: DinB family protein [Longimicrobiales bacterium]|nr:DinB family protein [Longimicrobiales bacterium]